MEKGVIGIIFISLFILFGSVAFITAFAHPIPNGEGDVGALCTPECTGTDQCDASGQCVECLDAGDCASGESCDASGSCVAATGCTQDSDCSPSICFEGSCLACDPSNCVELGYECGTNMVDACGRSVLDCGGCTSGQVCDAGGSCVTGGATTCTDPDGLDYYVRETCTDSIGTSITDFCSGGLLYEAYCGTSGADSFCVTQAHDCLIGEVCSNGACVVPTSSSCELVSDTDTLIDGSHSIPSDTISAWTAVIPGATWIWEEATVGNPTVETIVVFTKTFYLSSTGGTLGGTLVVAADNSYSCTLNDVVFEDANENNFRDDTKDTYDLGGKLSVGRNTLVCEVTNWAQVGGTGASNPAGLLYGLSVTGESCVVVTDTTCTDSDGGRNYLSPGTASTDEAFSIDSCSADGSTLKEYYCADGAITSIDYVCDCIVGNDGGYCELSGAGLVCKEFNSHSVVAGALVPMPETEMRDFVDEEIQQRLGLEETHEGFIAALILSEVPVKSKVENSGGVDDIYYCGLDLLWHSVKYTVADIACINEPNIPCLSNTACLSDSECYLDYSCENLLGKDGNLVLDESDDPITFCNYNTACLEDHECTSNTCVDNHCISISAELVAQRSILTSIWCVVTNLPSFLSDGGVESDDYLLCMYESFGGV